MMRAALWWFGWRLLAVLAAALLLSLSGIGCTGGEWGVAAVAVSCALCAAVCAVFLWAIATDPWKGGRR